MNRRGFLGALLAAPAIAKTAVKGARTAPRMPAAEGRWTSLYHTTPRLSGEFTPEQLSYAGKAALEFYLKNEPRSVVRYWMAR